MVLQTVTPLPDASGEAGHFLVARRDLIVDRHGHSRIASMAERDEVTGLLERKSFINRLRAEIGQHRASGRSLAVLEVVLERFQGTCDTFGDRAGDAILRETAARLERALAGAGTTGRLDSGTFAMLAPGCGTPGEVASLAERLLAALARPVGVAGASILVGAHIGVSVFPHDGDGHEAILRNARLASQRAGSDGARGYCLYDAAFEAEIGERASIERSLTYSLSTGGLALAYQPEWSIATGRITGAESLLRWPPGTRRGISTRRIVSIAEESGLILPIGQWVARTALEQLRDWRRRLDPDLSLGVNLSAVQLNQQDVADLFIRAIGEHAIPPPSVKVELTESALVKNSPRALASLNALHEAGVGLVLDDFGTGYSSLTYLQRFPIESVKIDCSFVGGIGVRSQDEAIVKGIILLAHSLGLTVVAEGVENAEQLEFLKSVECDSAQGYLLSAALPAAEFEALLLKDRAPWHAAVAFRSPRRWQGYSRGANRSSRTDPAAHCHRRHFERTVRLAPLLTDAGDRHHGAAIGGQRDAIAGPYHSFYPGLPIVAAFGEQMPEAGLLHGQHWEPRDFFKPGEYPVEQVRQQRVLSPVLPQIRLMKHEWIHLAAQEIEQSQIRFPVQDLFVGLVDLVEGRTVAELENSPGSEQEVVFVRLRARPPSLAIGGIVKNRRGPAGNQEDRRLLARDARVGDRGNVLGARGVRDQKANPALRRAPEKLAVVQSRNLWRHHAGVVHRQAEPGGRGAILFHFRHRFLGVGPAAAIARGRVAVQVTMRVGVAHPEEISGEPARGGQQAIVVRLHAVAVVGQAQAERAELGLAAPRGLPFGGGFEIGAVDAQDLAGHR